MKIFSWFGQGKPDIKKVAEKQLDKNMSVITSLRDYDTGKKTIRTDNVEKRLSNIRVAP